MVQFIVVGLVLGSIYALAASGLVITYVSTGVLNFAFGSLAFFIARTYYYLHVEKEWGILARPALCLLVLSPAHGAVPLHGDLPVPAAVVAADQGRRHHRHLGGDPRRSPPSSSARPRSSSRPGLAPQPVNVYTSSAPRSPSTR